MKSTRYTALTILLVLINCAQKKEGREDYKNEHDKDFLRNKVGNSAVPNSEKAITVDDSSTVSKQAEESPTNYKKNNKPNTGVGGAR
ncbi:hypothetical protein OMO38_19060 [Chryseobacterium sp. 09-1422]|uniref:Lipoprotein n=1 Tax=Chryseobacterium kimseyorum TaxID=2984028 RepID=A0ABT3I3U2_9FLAO|nr:hypothetical protein [Chryseobacterium kimseyorum]MCW3170634.1 hypothetical protein [Chryseobacterium kimseyorum]